MWLPQAYAVKMAGLVRNPAGWERQGAVQRGVPRGINRW